MAPIFAIIRYALLETFFCIVNAGIKLTENAGQK